MVTSRAIRTVCFVCEGTGHYARDCPEAATKAKCRICNEYGHFAASCPSLRCYESLPEVLLCTNSPFALKNNAISSCFPRRFVLFAPNKFLFPPDGHALPNVQLRKDMVAQVVAQALFLGHGVRSNTVLDVWAREGVYRAHTSEPRNKITAPDEHAVLNYLSGLSPIRYPEAVRHVLSEELRIEETHGQDTQQDTHVADTVCSLPHLVAVLDESAEVELEQYLRELVPAVKAGTAAPLSDLAFILGDHEGLDAKHHKALKRLCQNTASECISIRLGLASLLGSQCAVIIHFLLDKLHLCPLKLWSTC
eukprot:gnl/TRDRNA2_/TRDRNA2_163615_c0_seq1.p1 gnl/TRDRNA2_/TRDRNA2_163615_c0~~gnl/TRDRNA2_/TRDRNA2_163615_c0_seq1.p1  ORF type:complete len:320 (+),score=49.99 gnl/TRDRNA2_/TRDRNA2_163615_c0_seq1:41-961(+)